MHNFVQNTNATSNFDGIFYQIRHRAFLTKFSPESVLVCTLTLSETGVFVLEILRGGGGGHIVPPSPPPPPPANTMLVVTLFRIQSSNRKLALALCRSWKRREFDLTSPVNLSWNLLRKCISCHDFRFHGNHCDRFKVVHSFQVFDWEFLFKIQKPCSPRWKSTKVTFSECL